MLHAVALLLWAPSPVVAMTPAPSPPAHEALLRSGDGHRDARRDLDAIRNYEGAYVLMPAESRVGPLGQYVVVEAARAYERLQETNQDLDQLKACETFLSRHIDAIDRSHTEDPPAEPDEWEIYIRQRLTTVRSRIAELEAARRKKAIAALPAPLPRPEPGPTIQSVPERIPPRRDALGVSLLATGTIATLGGGALLVHGLLFPSRIAEAKARRRALDEQEGTLSPDDPDPPGYVTHERKMHRRGITLTVTGACLAAAGLVTAALGQRRLIKRRREASSVTVALSLYFNSHASGIASRVQF